MKQLSDLEIYPETQYWKTPQHLLEETAGDPNYVTQIQNIYLNHMNINRHITDTTSKEPKDKAIYIFTILKALTWKQKYHSLHPFSIDLYLDCNTHLHRVLTFQIEHRMSIHAVNKQIEGTVLPIADVSSSTVKEA